MDAQLIRCLLAALCALVLAGCPDVEPLPPTGRTIVLALEDNPDVARDGSGWNADQRRLLTVKLPMILGRTGTRFVWGASADANIILTTAVSGDCATEGGGAYIPGSRRAYVDPACAFGQVPLVTICLHETMHAYEHIVAGTVAHICLRPGDATNCWLVEYGPSVMNPWLPAAFDENGNPLGPTEPELNELTLRWVRSFQ